jgi:hypothetical protein
MSLCGIMPGGQVYGLLRFGKRMYYADNYGAFVFQIEPIPTAWRKAGPDEEWKYTRDPPLELHHLSIGRLYKEPMTDVDLPNCRLLRWKPAETEFCYEPDWDDSVPLDEWKRSNELAPIQALFHETGSDGADKDLPLPQDWVALVNGFMDSVPHPLLERLRRFPAGSWKLLEAAYYWDGFEELMDSNPALAVCLALRVRVGKKPGVRRKALDYGRLVLRRQREIADAIGFGDTESIVSILKKLVIDACTPRYLSFLSDLIRDPLILPHLQNARQISGPAIFVLQDYLLNGKLAGDFITEMSHEFPLMNEITSVAEGARQLRGGTRLDEFYDLYLGMRDLARFNPDVVIHSVDDFRTKHAAMIKKLNTGAVGKRAVRFPEAPFAGTEHIQPITTAAELAGEGREMHHCVKSYTRDVFKGLMAVYRVTHPERATLSLERCPRGWRLGQLKLENNRAPADKTVEFVNAWLRKMGVRIGRGPQK